MHWNVVNEHNFPLGYGTSRLRKPEGKVPVVWKKRDRRVVEEEEERPLVGPYALLTYIVQTKERIVCTSPLVLSTLSTTVVGV